MNQTNELNKAADDFDLALRKAKIINEIINLDECIVCDVSSLKKLMTMPCKLSLNDLGELCATRDDGEVIILDPKSNNLPELTSLIPQCPIDVQCGGIKSKQQEAYAIWKCVLVNVISQRVYEDEILAILDKGYDADRLKDAEGEMPFVRLLNKIQQNKNFVIAMLLQAINIKLANQVEKNGKPYLGVISVEATINLDSISRRMSALDFDKSCAIGNSKDKLERLTIMDEYDRRKSEVLANETEDMNILYRIASLDTNVVPFQKIVMIDKVARKTAEAMISNDNGFDFEKGEKLRKNLVRRGKRQYLIQFQTQAFKKFSEGERKDLIPKV
jgi:hypothetical protein